MVREKSEDVSDREDQSIDQMRQQLIDAELSKANLVKEMEVQKERARTLLVKKDVSESRLKLIINKLELFLRKQFQISPDEIQQIGSLTKQELDMYVQKQREMNQSEICACQGS